MSRVPRRVVGRKVVGYMLLRNRSQIGDQLWPSAEQAMGYAATLCDYPLEWKRMGPRDDGHTYWQGGHPDVMAYDEKYRTLYSYSSEEKSADSDLLRQRLGCRVWGGRWQVEPEYEDVFRKVKGAVRALPGSPVYVFPTENGWEVGSENKLQINRYFEYCYKEFDDALLEARKFELGIKTNKERSVFLRDSIAAAVVLLPIALAVVWSIYTIFRLISRRIF